MNEQETRYHLIVTLFLDERLRWYQMVKMPRIPAPVRSLLVQRKKEWKNRTTPWCRWQRCKKTGFPSGGRSPRTIPPSATGEPLVPGQFYRSPPSTLQPSDDQIIRSRAADRPWWSSPHAEARTLFSKPATKLTVLLLENGNRCLLDFLSDRGGRRGWWGKGVWRLMT